MIITVKVSAGARTEKIEEVDIRVLKIRVRETPEKNMANKRVIELVARHYGVSFDSVLLVSGATFREKIFLVEN